MPRSVFDCSRLTGRAKSLQLQTPLTLNQPDEWAVSQGVAGRAYYHLWRSISRILFSLSLSAVMSSGADFDTLWHCSQARLCCASIVLPVPQQPNVLQELLDGPKAWLAPITAWGLSHVLSAPHLLVLCRNIIRMRMHSMIVSIEQPLGWKFIALLIIWLTRKPWTQSQTRGMRKASCCSLSLLCATVYTCKIKLF